MKKILENIPSCFLKFISAIFFVFQDKVLITQWKDEIINGHKTSLQIMSNMTSKGFKIYGALTNSPSTENFKPPLEHRNSNGSQICVIFSCLFQRKNVFIIWIRVYNERDLEAFSTSHMQLILHEKWRAHIVIYRVMFLQVDFMVPRILILTFNEQPVSKALKRPGWNLQTFS